MHKKIFLSLLVLLCLNIVAYPQQLNNWYFGWQVNLNFNTSPPSLNYTNNMWAEEGCSFIGDSLGNILFYTNGLEVYNKNHVMMPNGNGLLGGVSTTQSALVIPRPGFPDRFYIFTNDDQGGPDGLRVSEVDISLGGGNGDVVNKNIFLEAPVCEKITAAYHANGTDIWVVCHGLNTNEFISYLVTSSGVSSVPVITPVGIVYYGGFSNNNTAGHMKFSPDGSYIGIVTDSGQVELFEFDRLNGTFYNEINLSGTCSYTYGIEFSPDNSKVYVAGTHLIQFDLDNFNFADILASRSIIHTYNLSSFFTNVALAPDGKIYAVDYYSNVNGLKLGAINNPNDSATSCNFDSVAIVTSHLSSAFSLPNLFSGLLKHTYVSVPEIKSDNDRAGFFPNPFNSSANFVLKHEKHKGILMIYDYSGRECMQLSVTEAETPVILDHCTNGMYFWQFYGEDFSTTGKLIKQ